MLPAPHIWHFCSTKIRGLRWGRCNRHRFREVVRFLQIGFSKSRLEVFRTVYSQIRVVTQTLRSPSGHRQTAAPHVLGTVRAQMELQQRSSGHLRQVAPTGDHSQPKYKGAQPPPAWSPGAGRSPGSDHPLSSEKETGTLRTQSWPDQWRVARASPSAHAPLVCLKPPPRLFRSRSPSSASVLRAWPVWAQGRRPACVPAPDFISG